MFEHGMITSDIKKQTSICCSISLNPYMVLLLLLLLLLTIFKEAKYISVVIYIYTKLLSTCGLYGMYVHGCDVFKKINK